MAIAPIILMATWSDGVFALDGHGRREQELAGRAVRGVPNPNEGVYPLTGVQPGFG